MKYGNLLSECNEGNNIDISKIKMKSLSFKWKYLGIFWALVYRGIPHLYNPIFADYAVHKDKFFKIL